MKALLLENIHPSSLPILERYGISPTVYPKSLGEDELIHALKDVSVLAIRSRTAVTRKVLENAPNLLAVGAYCIGTNNIDLHAASMHGVAVFNAPYSNTRSVAELAIGEIIMLMRQVFDKSTKTHQGIWDKTAIQTHEVRGKKLGILGFGNIGSQVSLLAEAMGMEVYYYDTVDKLSIGNARKLGSMDEVLQIADVVTLHVDGRTENTCLIGQREFDLMKNGVIFLNLSRGFVVDIPALSEALKSGKVLGAALDVFPEEPSGADERFVSPLQNMPNVLLTPHIGGSTEEAQFHIGEFVSHKLVEYLLTGTTYSSVNFPKIQLPSVGDTHRILHIHHNVPGVLSKLNGVFAKFSLNIVGQYLRTNENIGYVIADVDKNYNDEVLQELENVEHTIRLRLLY